MANIQKRSNDKWRVRVFLGEAPDGKQIVKSFTYTVDHNLTVKQNEKAAQKAAVDFERRLNNGTIDGDRITVQELGKRWIETYVKPELEKSTYRRYEEALEKYIYPRIGYLKVSEVKPMTVQTMLNDMRNTGYKYDSGRAGDYSDETLRTAKVTLSALMSQAVAEGLIDRNPCYASRQRKHKKVERPKVEALTLEQAQELLTALETPIPVICKERTNKIHGKETTIRQHVNRIIEPDLQFRAMITLTLFSGIRRGELMALNWNDFDFERGTVRIDEAAGYTPQDGSYLKTPKSQSGYRTITLPSAVIDLMKQLQHEHKKQMMKMGTAWTGCRILKDSPCFIQKNGERMNVQTPTCKLIKVIRAYNANLPKGHEPLPEIGLHKLRHTHASLLIASKALEITGIASRLGHSDPTVTLQIYAHAYEEADSVAANVLETMILTKQA